MTKRPALRAQILQPTPRNLARLARALRAGEIVAVPTETVYGLAANALDARACRKIFAAKRRPTTDPLIVHVHAQRQVPTLAEMNDAARILARTFWPGPLTIVLPKKSAVPDVVTAGRDSVAVRMPAHAVFRRLLRLAGIPLAAPSANPFGYVSPTMAAHVRDSLAGRVPFILDGGPCRIGLESTIVDLRDPKNPRLLRPGVVTRAAIEAALGREVRETVRHARTPAGRGQLAPGTLARHYSPRTPVVLHGAAMPETAEGEALLFVRRPDGRRGKNIFWLDAHGNLRGAARRLFALLRELDDRGFTRIHAQLVGDESGLAAAINDRLRRAAAR